MPLVDPLPADTDGEMRKLAEFFNETLGFCPNSVLTMQHRPDHCQGLHRLEYGRHAKPWSGDKCIEAADRLRIEPCHRLRVLSGTRHSRRPGPAGIT